MQVEKVGCGYASAGTNAWSPQDSMGGTTAYDS